MSNIQAHVVFRGRVQGVGFRFTVERLAVNSGINGWVKNLSNGDVELVIEAEKKAVDDFLDKLRSQFHNYIHDEEIDLTDASANFDDFQIKF
jgi:acylphosphatase